MVKEVIWHKMLKRPYRLDKALDTGNGPINILLIHGLASRSGVWQPLIDILEQDKYRVRSFDLLGFGISPKPKRSRYSTQEHAKALLHTLGKDALPDEQFILIGHSMGCLIATHITYLHPEKVRGVILYKPPLLLDKEEKQSFHEKMYQHIAKKPAGLSRYSKLANKLSNKVSGFDTTNAKIWRPIENSLNNTILAQQTLAELQSVDKPTHIIYGRFDFLVSKIKAKRLSSINPKLHLHRVTEMHDVKPKSSRYMKKLIEDL